VSATGLVALMGLIQNILTGRLLGVDGIGLLATIIMFTSVINKFASFRMSELVIKYVGQYSENQDPVRSSAVFKTAALTEVGASILAFGLIVLLAPLGSRFLAKDSDLTGLFIFYGLIVLANLIAESSTGLLQIFNQYRLIAGINILGSTITLIGIVTVFIIFQFILPNKGLAQGPIETNLVNSISNLTSRALPYVLLVYIVGKVTGALGLTLSALREAVHKWGSSWWRVPINTISPQKRELLHFAVSTNISATLSLVNKDAELLWISLFRSTTEVGYYKTALSLINLVQLPVSPLPQATYPELSREVARKNWKNVRDVLRRGTLLAGSFSLIMMIGLIVFGRQLILLFYRDPGFLPAYPALLILIPGFFIATTFYWSRTALLALGKPEFPTKVNLLLAAIKLVGVLLLVPRFGYLANAALLSGYYIFGVSAAVIKTRSVLAKNEQVSPQAISTLEG